MNMELYCNCRQIAVFKEIIVKSLEIFGSLDEAFRQ